jgi:hypothetical protein
VTYWYGLNKPALLLTDELDVGNEADEKRHDFRSPDATAPEQLATRFELGIDHLPLLNGLESKPLYSAVSDDGRRTKTSTEFTLNITNNNLGVLLRRRLDLNYPNQKARVSVSDAEGPVQWREVGSWYTAGGNPAVFGDPLGLPKESLKVHPELAAPAHIVWSSDHRWREDEFMLPRQLTEKRSRIRVRLEFQPVGLPLFPGHPLQEEAWTEFRYWAYCFVMPR